MGQVVAQWAKLIASKGSHLLDFYCCDVLTAKTFANCCCGANGPEGGTRGQKVALRPCNMLPLQLCRGGANGPEGGTRGQKVALRPCNDVVV